jgi:hypothetical protein
MLGLLLRHGERALTSRAAVVGGLGALLGIAAGAVGGLALSASCFASAALIFFLRILVLQARLDEADLLLRRFEKASAIPVAAQMRSDKTVRHEMPLSTIGS